MPIRYKNREQLATWVSDQRRVYEKYLKKILDSLDRERMRILNNLGFEWIFSRKQVSLVTLLAPECKLI